MTDLTDQQPVAAPTAASSAPYVSDLIAVLILVALTWIFNWRLMTPNAADQLSMVEGDFSGQFVAFAGYQAERLGAGEVPLWNPYNLGGHPFLADTQSAVFYPPRLLSIAALNPGGGTTPARVFDALQREMVAHMLLGALLMYAFVRRLTAGEMYSGVGGLVSAIIFAFGGYMTGYPQLQLAIMEAAVWLPLALLGILEATRASVRLRGQVGWFGLAGVALGLSLLAGHPQTTLFVLYLMLAYLVWRVYSEQRPWQVLVLGMAIFVLVGGGLSAVQVVPGWEYQALTTRGGMNFDAKGNGFPFYDVMQVIFPGLFSQWSPLYFGVVGLMLVIYAAWRLRRAEFFWFGVLGFALALSFGRGTIVYDLVYNFAPGFSLFRGQERAAYMVAVATAILAGLGAGDALRDTMTEAMPRRFSVIFASIAAGTFSLAVGVFVDWLSAPAEAQARFQVATFGVLMTLISAGLLINLANWRHPLWLRLRVLALVGLLVFELFTVGRLNPNVEAMPTAQRMAMPLLVETIREDTNGLFRSSGIPQNYGTLYGVQDAGGISPLRLASVDRLLNLPSQPRMWEALAVRYVLTEDRQLPVPSEVVAQEGKLRLHRLTTTRPFVRLVYRAWIEPDDAKARGILSEPAFESGTTVILAQDPGAQFTASNGSAEVTAFAPEQITIRTSSPQAAILQVSLVNYPGWQAEIDGQAVPLLRADIALMAVVVPAGDHTVQFTFAPRSYQIGLLVSLVTLLGVLIACAYFLVGGLRRQTRRR